MSLWITWPLVIKATVIGFEVVFASKINFCIFGKHFTIYSRGFNQECGGVKTYGRLVQNSGNPKKQNHCLPPVKWTVRVRIIIWWYIHGVFLWSSLAHMTEYISPTRINLGFGWPTKRRTKYSPSPHFSGLPPRWPRPPPRGGKGPPFWQRHVDVYLVANMV